MTISELLLERDKLIGDFISAMGEWLDEFNKVTDEMLGDFKSGGNLMDMDGVDDRRDDSYEERELE